MAARVLANRGAGDENRNPNVRDVNVTVEGMGLDCMIPVIPRADKSDIKAGFKFAVLTEIKGKPTYEQMKEITRQMARNALTVKVSFGGGKHRILALVIGDDEFLKETTRPGSSPTRKARFQPSRPTHRRLRKRRPFQNSSGMKPTC